MTQVVIYDFHIHRRMVYALTETDFEFQREHKDDSDKLLESLQDHDFFAGRTRWSDLEIRHFHVMIVNVLKILSDVSDRDRVNRQFHAVRSLTFMLCSVIDLLKRPDAHIDHMKITRMSADDVVYDYTSTLDIEIAAPAVGKLRVVVDND